MKEIFVLECSSGQYDSRSQWIDSVWSTMELAQKREGIILAEIERDRQIPDQWSDENGKQIDVENITEHEYESRAVMQSRKEDAQEFGSCTINVFKIDEK